MNWWFLAIPILAYVTNRIRIFLLQLPPRLEAEPPGLAVLLEAVERRHLSEEEREEFGRTGVVHIKGVIDDPALMAFLSAQIGHLARPEDDEGMHHAWLFHGPLRALVRDQLLSELAASAVGIDFKEQGKWAALEEAVVWFSLGQMLGGKAVDLYHADDRFHISAFRPYPLVSVWLALTDSVTPLEFVRGSHKALDHMNHGCGIEFGGVNNFIVYPQFCADRYRDLLMNLTGVEPLFSANVTAGDAFVFHGLTLHRRLEQQAPRLAVTARYRFQDGERPESPSTHYLFPRHPAEVDAVPWFVIPPLGELSPQLPPESRGDLGKWSA
mmetsp:Transcript_85326/g.206802  ORF Transcript_85326/g.206802 Transcript_85326/m.206802 type:complete len:326 (+) Transcript_85326:76-1053(+)